MRKGDYPKVLRRGVAVMVILLLLLLVGAFAPVAMAQAPLVANFTHTAPQCYCTDIYFNGTATGGSPSYNYSWDFGDGNSSTGQNTSHHYGSYGPYTVNLTVTDSGSPANTSNISKNVQVWPTPVANFTTNSPEFYCYNITFKDTTTGGTSPYTYWDWDFGDGSNSTEQNTSHRYSNPGTYTVTLNVTDLDGCTNSTTKEVEAEDYTASLEITKSANVTVAGPDTKIGYTINVSNTGDVNLTNVLVTDNLTGLNATIPILAAGGAPETFNTTYNVTESDICALRLTNTATANGTDPCGNPVGPKSASVAVAMSYTRGLGIIKGANVTAAPIGTVIGYWINVTNTGGVNFTDVLVTAGGIERLNEIIPRLAPHKTETLHMNYTVTETDVCTQWIRNIATANGTDPCNETLEVSGPFDVRPGGYVATLSITKEANVTLATIGTVIGYWINVTNTGNVNLTSVLVRDSLTGLNETISTLAPGATRTFNTTYTVTELNLSGWIINRATANGTDPCGYLTPTAIGVFGVRSG